MAGGVLAEILRFVTPRIEVRRRRRVEADTEAALGGDAGKVGGLVGGGGEAVKKVASARLAGGDEEGGTFVSVVVGRGGGGARAEVAIEGEPGGVIVNRGEVALGA